MNQEKKNKDLRKVAQYDMVRPHWTLFVLWHKNDGSFSKLHFIFIKIVTWEYWENFYNLFHTTRVHKM